MDCTKPTTARKRRRVSRVAAVVAAVGVLAACGDTGAGSGATAAPSASSSNTVTMRLIAFKPSNLTVEAGTAVTWEQTDAGAHTVTSGTVAQGAAGVTEEPDGTFDSGEIAQGDTFELTFDEPGTYPYFCAIHPATMRGEVVVR
ncbi:MAG: cupredoxin domain-containing protein [Microthrixaceae bacterium]